MRKCRAVGVGGSLGRLTLGIDRVRRITHSPIKSDKWQRQTLINRSLRCRYLAAGITESQVAEEAARLTAAAPRLVVVWRFNV